MGEIFPWVKHTVLTRAVAPHPHSSDYPDYPLSLTYYYRLVKMEFQTVSETVWLFWEALEHSSLSFRWVEINLATAAQIASKCSMGCLYPVVWHLTLFSWLGVPGNEVTVVMYRNIMLYSINFFSLPLLFWRHSWSTLFTRLLVLMWPFRTKSDSIIIFCFSYTTLYSLLHGICYYASLCVGSSTVYIIIIHDIITLLLFRVIAE